MRRKTDGFLFFRDFDREARPSAHAPGLAVHDGITARRASHLPRILQGGCCYTCQNGPTAAAFNLRWCHLLHPWHGDLADRRRMGMPRCANVCAARRPATQRSRTWHGASSDYQGAVLGNAARQRPPSLCFEAVLCTLLAGGVASIHGGPAAQHASGRRSHRRYRMRPRRPTP